MYQLANPDFKFCKIKKGEKKPFEQQWQSKKYSLREIMKWVNNGNNYGVRCGDGGLIVIDADDPVLGLAVFELLPPTLRVKTGGGGTHDYYLCPELTKKVVLTKGKIHYGEIQSTGAQVVGAGSTHPNGELYRVVSDRPIETITLKQLRPIIDQFKDLELIPPKRPLSNKEFTGENIGDIPMDRIVNMTGFKSRGYGELIGANPWHGSTSKGKGNTTYTKGKNLMYCFRCNTCINSVTAIALNEGITSSCSERISHDQFLEVLNKAKEKYGLQ